MATVRNTIQLRDKTSSVLRAIMRNLDATEDAMGAVDRASEVAFNNVQQNSRQAQRAVNNLHEEMDDLRHPISAVRSGFASWQSAIITANQGIQLLREGFAGLMAVTNFADQQTGLTSRLTLMTGSLEKAKALQEDIMAAANRSRASYTATADSVAQMGMMAADAFSDVNGNLNTDELVAFTEAINKQLVISGAAGTAGADAALYQLSQAMASGTLRGDELRSVMEQAPVVADTIAKYMGISKGELRELAAEGMVTSDIVKKAMIASLDETNEKFSEMPTTFGQAMTMLKNYGIQQLLPLTEQFSNFMQSTAFQKGYLFVKEKLVSIIGFIQRIISLVQQPEVQNTLLQFASALVIVSDVLGFIANGVVSVADIFLSNWSLFAPIILAAAGAAAVYFGIMRGIAIVQGIVGAFQTVLTFLQIGWGLLTGSTAAASAATMVYNGVLTITQIKMIMIIGIIALIIAAIFLVIAIINKVTGSSISAVGVIIGAVMWLAATLYNIVIGIANALLTAIWNNFVNPWISIIEWVLNVFNGGFNSFGDAVRNLLGNIINWFLTLGTVVTKIIDAIFGTNWTGGLNSLQDKVLEWGKNDQAITLSREAPTIGQRVSATDAYSSGYTFGSNLQDKFSDPFGGMTQKLTGMQATAQDQLAATQAVEDTLTGAGANVKGEVSITEEDIKMLKDVAATEWVNKFTTLNPNMQISFGDVHETADVNKILEVIEEMVEEAYATSLV